RADFADADAYRVIQPLVRRGVAGVEDRADDLAAPGRISAPVPAPLEHDHGAILGLDGGTEVRPERSSRPVPAREVRAAKAPADHTLASPLGEEQVLLPAAVEADHP